MLRLDVEGCVYAGFVLRVECRLYTERVRVYRIFCEGLNTHKHSIPTYMQYIKTLDSRFSFHITWACIYYTVNVSLGMCCTWIFLLCIGTLTYCILFIHIIHIVMRSAYVCKYLRIAVSLRHNGIRLACLRRVTHQYLRSAEQSCAAPPYTTRIQ